jgi:hypothetical protein
MKKYILILASSILVVACGNNNADGPEEKEDTVTALNSWEATLNDSGRLEVKRSEQPGPDSLSAEAVIGFLNKRYPNVQLQLVKTSGDTLYMSIPEATYLTQQMGSSGPQIYFADVVYNLTEIPGIRYVNFNFEEGDHATPAVLNRNSFRE